MCFSFRCSACESAPARSASTPAGPKSIEWLPRPDPGGHTSALTRRVSEDSSTSAALRRVSEEISDALASNHRCRVSILRGSDCVPEVPSGHHRNEGSHAKPVTTHGVVRGSDGGARSANLGRQPDPPQQSHGRATRNVLRRLTTNSTRQAATASSRIATELSACFCAPRPHLRISSPTDRDVRTQGRTSHIVRIGLALASTVPIFGRDRLLSDAEVSTRNGEALAVKSTSPP